MEVISQREARFLRKRVRVLEDAMRQARAHWRQDYPGGVHLGNIDMTTMPRKLGRTEGARYAGMAIVAVPVGNDLRLYAVPQDGVPK